MQIGAHPREAREKIGNLGPLRSHLLDFQAPYSEHWSGGRRNCRICSTAPVGLIAFFCMACQTCYNFAVTMPTNFTAQHF